MEKYTSVTLIAVVLFVIINLSMTYDITRKVFGPVVGTTDYGTGNSFTDRGFILHALVFGGIFFFIAKRQLK